MLTPKTKRPKKPRPNFPLFPHLNGSWTAVIDGRQKSFGGWRHDPKGEAAYARWEGFTKSRREGREAPVFTGNISVRDLFIQFLDAKRAKIARGELENRTYDEYRTDLAEFARIVGTNRDAATLGPSDFGKVLGSYEAAGNGPRTIAGKVGNVRAAFRFAEKQRLIERSPHYGGQFDKPAAKAKRRASREAESVSGKRIFEPDSIQAILAAAPPTLKACVLLGLNCGLLAIDCARLTSDAIDLDKGWMTFVRQKTETHRAAALWPETVDAVRDSMAVRPAPVDYTHASLVFLTKRGVPLVHDKVTVTDDVMKVRRSDSLNQALADLLNALGKKRKGINFSAFRKTYRTAADEVGDRNAVLLTMGHAFPGMDEHYVRSVSEERLRAVADYVRAKLLNAQRVSLAGATPGQRGGK